jgi:hypothetical protein
MVEQEQLVWKMMETWYLESINCSLEGDLYLYLSDAMVRANRLTVKRITAL